MMVKIPVPYFLVSGVTISQCNLNAWSFCVRCLLPSDGIPSDGSALNVTHSIEIGLTSVMYILAPIGIAGAIICFAFIVVFRHKRQGAAKSAQSVATLHECVFPSP